MKSLAERKRDYFNAASELQHAINTCKCPQEHRVFLGMKVKVKRPARTSFGSMFLGSVESVEVREYSCMLCGARFEQADAQAPVVKTHIPRVRMFME